MWPPTAIQHKPVTVQATIYAAVKLSLLLWTIVVPGPSHDSGLMGPSAQARYFRFLLGLLT